MTVTAPNLSEIQETREVIDPFIVETPVWQWRNHVIDQVVSSGTRVFLKLELFQHTGTFKPRGALSNMLALSDSELSKGVTAFSAGNHAIAVGYAASVLGTTSKVVMPDNANPSRVALCREYGAEIELVSDIHQAFERVNQIEAEEGRTFIHPFEGKGTARGTATVGWELGNQVEDLDAVIVPVGGGGLCSGVASAVKQLQPNCQIFGVEPEGADSMHRSFAAGRPVELDAVRTIADSLGPPHARPYSYEVCKQFVDDLVLISDDDMRRAMLLIFQGVKLAVEPAGAAATAALIGPLRERLAGKKVGLIVCGANIDVDTFARHISEIPE